MSNDRPDERTRRMRDLLTCPHCRRERVVVKNGLVCEMWGCGGVVHISKKELTDVKRFLRERLKEEQRPPNERSAYLQ